MDLEVSKIISSLRNSLGKKYSSEEALLLLDNEMAKFVVDYINNFTNLNAEVAKKLIEIGQAGLVVKNKDLFVGFKLDSDAAIKMIENGQDKIVVENIEKFRNLNTAVVVKLMEVGYTEEVLLWIKNSHQSFDIEGMLKDKDKNFSFNSYYVYEIVKHPSLISDICS